MGIDTAAGTPPELRRAMVDELLGWAAIRTVPVEAAMRAVERHVFVPGVPAEQAYGYDAVVTHRNRDGVAVSSASAPGVVAKMLEQLDARPGHRVLEIGAGTGYNAALLSHLVGPSGEVTTVDIDAEVIEGARRGLDAAGYGNVRLICGDGEYGCADHAPYDRVIVTVGAWDLPPAWMDQLAPGGRIVVPLRMRGLTRTVAFERDCGCWRSRSVEVAGFVSMRGIGEVPERTIRLGDTAALRVDDGQPVDAEALGHALDHPPAVSWTGVAIASREISDLEFRLAAMDGFSRFMVDGDVGLVTPVYRWGSMAVFEGAALAYLTCRPSAETGDTGAPMSELGVCAYGPTGEPLAHRVADQIRAWGDERRSLTSPRIEIHPAGTGNAPTGQMVIDKRHTRVIVHTTRVTEEADES